MVTGWKASILVQFWRPQLYHLHQLYGHGRPMGSHGFEVYPVTLLLWMILYPPPPTDHMLFSGFQVGYITDCFDRFIISITSKWRRSPSIDFSIPPRCLAWSDSRDIVQVFIKQEEAKHMLNFHFQVSLGDFLTKLESRSTLSIKTQKLADVK